MIENKKISDYSIFIPMAAVNELYIKMTIESALKTAAHPERISFGVWEHSTTGEFTDLTMFSNIKHSKLQYNALLGVGLARQAALAFYDQEDFIFQIDAHMLFKEGWDNKLINRYFEISNIYKTDKIIITTHGPWWSFKDSGDIYYSLDEDRMIALSYELNLQVKELEEAVLWEYAQDINVGLIDAYCINNNNEYLAIHKYSPGPTTVQYFQTYEEMMSYFRFIWSDAGGYPRKDGYDAPDNGLNFFEHFNISSNYFFTIPKFIEDAMPDPLIMYAGEEVVAALRLWTRGYKMFTIKDLIVWHLNKNGIKNPLDRLYNPGDIDLVQHYQHKDRKNIERIIKILTGEMLGYWGAPSKELLEEYERANNLNFTDFYKKYK